MNNQNRKIATGNLLDAIDSLAKVKYVDCSLELMSLLAKLRGLHETAKPSDHLEEALLAKYMSDIELTIAYASKDARLGAFDESGKLITVSATYEYIRLYRPEILKYAEVLRAKGVDNYLYSPKVSEEKN